MKICKCGSEFVIRGPGKQCKECRRATGISNAAVVTKDVIDKAYGVAYLAARQSGKWHLLDELNAAALEGVAMAATTWDPNGDLPFRAFACIRAKGACQDLLRHWCGRHGRPSGPKMEATKVDLEELGAYETASGICDSSEMTWFGLTISLHSESLIERIKQILNPKQWEALSTLLTGETLMSVANRIGKTESRASQLRKEALDRLAEYQEELSLLDPRAA